MRGCVAEIRDLTTTHWVRSTERIRLSSFSFSFLFCICHLFCVCTEPVLANRHSPTHEQNIPLTNMTGVLVAQHYPGPWTPDIVPTLVSTAHFPGAGHSLLIHAMDISGATQMPFSTMINCRLLLFMRLDHFAKTGSGQTDGRLTNICGFHRSDGWFPLHHRAARGGSNSRVLILCWRVERCRQRGDYGWRFFFQ